jgi:hypothetical protein
MRGSSDRIAQSAWGLHLRSERQRSAVTTDPRVCCAACHADAAVNGDPSLRWDISGVRSTFDFTRGHDT